MRSENAIYITFWRGWWKKGNFHSRKKYENCELIQFHATIVFCFVNNFFYHHHKRANEIAIHIPFVSLLVFNRYRGEREKMLLECVELICCLPE